MMGVRVKRVYLSPEESDGQRILVDRLWPRGLKKEDAHIAIWLKEAAPTPELRQWYHQDRSRYEEFRRRYELELRERPETQAALTEIITRLKEDDVTLLYGTRDEAHNHASILQEFILENLSAL